MINRGALLWLYKGRRGKQCLSFYQRMAATVVRIAKAGRSWPGLVLLDDSLCQPEPHSFTRLRTFAHTLTRRHVWRGACCSSWKGVPNQSAPGPFILHWRASGTRAPGHSGGTETEQTGAGRHRQAATHTEHPDPDCKASFLSTVGLNPSPTPNHVRNKQSVVSHNEIYRVTVLLYTGHTV